jgi:aminoglycoside/choline kinase family phosphotransferase
MSDSAAAEREAQICRFLDGAGWTDTIRHPLAGDASFRRYERLAMGPRRAILMDAAPPTEDVRPFIHIARHLKRLGFSAPEILATDETAGLLLLEDLGETTYTLMLADGADEGILYARAVDLLIDLHSRPLSEAAPSDLPAYDEEKLLEEAALLVDWCGRGSGQQTASPALRRDYLKIWSACLSTLGEMPQTLVLRDYHVDNLIWLEGRRGVAACGLLDFQDAVIGPTPYDLVSLLKDARRDLAPGLEAAMKERYLAAFPGLDRTAFETAYRILGAQRSAKIIGIFTRLAIRDAKPGYLRHIPRVWRLLERDLSHPALEPLREWIGRRFPKEIREEICGVPARQAGT